MFLVVKGKNASRFITHHATCVAQVKSHGNGLKQQQVKGLEAQTAGAQIVYPIGLLALLSLTGVGVNRYTTH